METVYRILVRMHREEGLDFSLCRTFNLDEYVGLSPEDARSYRRYMNERLFSQVNLDLRNTNLPNGLAADWTQNPTPTNEKSTVAAGSTSNCWVWGRRATLVSMSRCPPCVPARGSRRSVP